MPRDIVLEMDLVIVKEMPKIVCVFDCPVHGEESQVFCFRAGDPALRSRWRRYEVTRTELPILYDPEALKEVQEIQERLRCRT